MMKNSTCDRHLDYGLIGLMSALICAYVFRVSRLSVFNAGRLQSAVWLTFLFAVLFLAGRAFLIKRDGCLAFIFKYRYVISALIIVVFVSLELNGTSLYQWSAFLSGDANEQPIWGTARLIRSDEWAVWSSFAFAQDYGGYPAISDSIAGGGTDVSWISVGGLPAWNMAAVFKPLYWGFLLLGIEKGYSILWISRLVLLFLVSFELARIYTRNQKTLSAAAAITLTFAPYVQWFFSQSIAEVFIYTQGILLAGYHYFKTERKSVRRVLLIIAAYLLGCFCMIAYPGWLISMLYLLIPLGILGLYQHRKAWNRKDLFYAGIFALIPLVWIAVIAYMSWDTLSAVSNSAYPGRRLITGGEIPPSFFTGLFSMLFPVKDVVPDTNVCEMANFLGFAPAGLILTAYSCLKKKKRDALSFVLIGIEAFFAVFVLIGVPPIVAKVTLLSQCKRIEPVIGLIDTILLYRNLSSKDAAMPVSLSAILAIITAGVISFAGMGRFDYSWRVIIGVFGIGTCTYFLIFHHDLRIPASTRRVAYIIMCIAILAGGFVNPIQKGTDCIDELELVKVLNSIEDGDGLYLVEDGFPYANAPLLAGKRCFNSTSVYPDIKKWEQLDPQHQYIDVYNRFCHTNTTLSMQETTFELIVQDPEDQIKVNLSFADLKKIGIEYVLSRNDYSGMTLPDVELVRIGQADVYYIYQVVYM